MKGHPAYSERPGTLATAPQNEPYVPFGVGEILKWTPEDIKELPNSETIKDDDFGDPMWTGAIRVNDKSHEELLRLLVDVSTKTDTIGFGYDPDNRFIDVYVI